MTVIPPISWVPDVITDLIGAIFIWIILRHEIKNRKDIVNKFSTKSLQLSSLSCIVSCFIAYFVGFLKYFDGFCYFGRFVGNTCFGIQIISMGFYQLSRLHYCFSNSQIHSDKGYPKIVFIIMYIMGILLLINWPFLQLGLGESSPALKSKCGINSKFQHDFDPVELLSVNDAFIWLIITGIIYLIWDIITLLLYALKIRLFKTYKETQPIVYKRILSILYKIFTITLFYEIVTLLVIILESSIGFFNDSFWSDLINDILFNLIPISICYSMYLMMEYNQQKYERFIKWIYYFKLHSICCYCCKFMVIEQINDLVVDQSMIENVIRENTEETGTKVATPNKIAQFDLSIETTVDL